MRISDWSSDVCSSDLPASRGARPCACLHTDHKPVAADCRFGQKLAQHFVRAWVDAADGLYNSPDGREHFGRDVWIKGEVASHLGHRQFRRQRGLIDERYGHRSEEHTSELQSLMRNSYAVFCLKKKKTTKYTIHHKPI